MRAYKWSRKPIDNGGIGIMAKTFGSKKAESGGQQALPGMPSWVVMGADAASMMEQEKAKQAAREEESGKLWRFALKPGKSAVVVFLDGFVKEDEPQKGMLQAPFFREHTLKTSPTRWENFVCLTMRDEPCPMCEQSGRDGDLCAAFTVIDTSETKGKNGKTYKNQRRLFIAKQRTYQQLQKMASKLGGLRGLVVDISRTDDKVARVGDSFLVDEKLTDEEIVEHFGEAAAEPTDWAEELKITEAEELVSRGIVQATGSVGAGAPAPGYNSAAGDSKVPF
jgi:hypothetical protein